MHYRWHRQSVQKESGSAALARGLHTSLDGGRVVQKGNRGRRGRSSGRWASASAPLNGPAGTLAPRPVTSAAAERPISGARASVFSGAPGRAAMRSEHPRACAAWMRPAAAAAALAFLAFNKRCIIVGRHFKTAYLVNCSAVCSHVTVEIASIRRDSSNSNEHSDFNK